MKRILYLCVGGLLLLLVGGAGLVACVASQVLCEPHRAPTEKPRPAYKREQPFHQRNYRKI